ncbi:MAG: CHASE4 domain-containing protein [bacterium]
MDKKNKLKISLFMLIFLMVGTFYLVFKNFMYSNVNFFEKYELNKEVSFAQKNIQRESYHLYEKVAEWGNWDDTYSFISNKNKHYIDNNLMGSPLFKQGEYLIVFFDNNRKVIYGLKYDNKTKQMTHITEEVESLLTTQKTQAGQKGILIIDDKIFIVAVHPIQTSRGTGPVKGMVLMARQMDPLLLDSQHADKLSFNFEILKNTVNISTHDRSLNRLAHNKISESIILADMYDRPAVRLEVTLERYMMTYTKKTLSYLILSLCFISTLFSFAIFYLTKKISSMEVQILEAGKLASLGALGASISHELNNPLTIVHGYTDNLSEILEEEGIKSKKVSSALEKIKTHTERMMGTIKHIKEFTRYAEGETYEPVNMNILLQNSLDEFKEQFEGHKIRLKIKQDEKLPPIFVNKTKMVSLLQNLLTNARDAVDEKTSGEEKKIEVMVNFESSDHDRFVVLKITDNGVGISKKDLPKIFEPYFTTKDIAKGTGLGLSLVQSIVREYNGKIDVESTNGQTSFTIKFPINPLLNEHRNV